MSEQKSLAKNSIYYLIYNTLNILFPLITGIYVSRVLLPDNIGEVAAAQNIAQYFVILAFLGIPTYGMREISKVRNDRNELSKVYSELFIINLISTTVFLLTYLGVIFAVPNYRLNFLIYLITGCSIALNAIRIDWLYEGLEEFRFISIRNIVFKTVSFVLLLLLVKVPSDYYWYAGITVIGTAGNYFVNVACSSKFAKFSLKNLNLKRHMKPVLLLTAVNLAIEIYTLVDVTMLDILCDKKNVAFYSYGSRIHKMLLQIVSSFTMVVVPRMSLYYKEQKYNEFNNLLSRTLKHLMLLSIPMIVGLWFTATDIICLLYTDVYINSATIVKILSFLLFISPVGYLLGSRVLLTVGHESKMIICVSIGAVINIIGNYFLIQMYNELGAAIASVLSEIVVMIIYVEMGKKHFKLKGVFQDAAKIVCSAGIMAICLCLFSLLNINVIAKLIMEIIAACIVYFGTLIVFREQIVLESLSKFRKHFSSR